MIDPVAHVPKGIGQCRIYSGWASPWDWSPQASPMSACATTREGTSVMTIDLWLAAFTAAGLLIYLVAVLVRPERF
jgi:K+-transporting ATPase KdpF subunit